MSTDWIAEARARCDAATPGPWHPQGLGDVMMPAPWTRSPWTANAVANCQHGEYDQRRTDAEFIAAARTDLPRALDALERVRAAVGDGDCSYGYEEGEPGCYCLLCQVRAALDGHA